MSASVEMIGLDALRLALRNLPEELTAEANAIVESHAAEAARLVQTAYPEGPTGKLKRGVSMRSEHGRFGVSAIVSSRARHSHLFERGTGPRRTASGANRGQMPAAPDSQRMIPIIVRTRRRMVAALIQLVERAGFTVVAS